MAFSKRIKVAGVSAATLALGIGTAGQAWNTDQSTFELTGYRVLINDCESKMCGPLSNFDRDDFSAFLADRSAKVAADMAARGGNADNNNSGKKGKLLFTEPQVVYLEFNSGTPTFPVRFTDGTIFGVFTSHFYTPAERASIQARLEADYADFNFQFTQSEPTSGTYSTLTFDCDIASTGGCLSLTPTGGISILFGRADQIDFRNLDMDDNAFIDGNFWEFLAQLDPSGGLFSRLSGLPVDANNSLQDQLSTAIVNQASNTGAHELGHILGLRHHDSFGAPGDGIPTTGRPDPEAFVPIYDGPQDASETILHLMASGASAGLPLQNSTTKDRFLSERSAVKLTVNEQVRLVSEEDVTGPKKVKIFNANVPNTIIVGENAGLKLDVEDTVVRGSISQTGEIDEYRFKAKAGEFFNAEMISFSSPRSDNPVIGALRLLQVQKDGSTTLVSENIQTFEPFDPVLLDVELPTKGEYILEVSAPNYVYFDYDPTNPGLDPFPLDETGNGDLRYGDYELNLYMATGKLNSRKKP